MLSSGPLVGDNVRVDTHSLSDVYYTPSPSILPGINDHGRGSRLALQNRTAVRTKPEPECQRSRRPTSHVRSNVQCYIAWSSAGITISRVTAHEHAEQQQVPADGARVFSRKLEVSRREMAGPSARKLQAAPSSRAGGRDDGHASCNTARHARRAVRRPRNTASPMASPRCLEPLQILPRHHTIRRQRQPRHKIARGGHPGPATTS